MEGLCPESPGNMLLLLRVMTTMIKYCTDSRNTFSDQLSVDIRLPLSHRVTVLTASAYTVRFILLSNSLHLRKRLLEREFGNGRGWKS